jgi:hypothetical protein
MLTQKNCFVKRKFMWNIIDILGVLNYNYTSSEKGAAAMKIFGKSIPKLSRNAKNLMAIIAIAVAAGLLLWLGILWLFSDRFPRAETRVDIVRINERFERLTFGSRVNFDAVFDLSSPMEAVREFIASEHPERAAVFLNGRRVFALLMLNWWYDWSEYYVFEGASFNLTLNLRSGLNEVTVLALNPYGHVIDEKTVYILSDHQTPQEERTLPIFRRISIDYDPDKPWIVYVVVELDKGNADEVSMSGDSIMNPGGGGRRIIYPIEKEEGVFGFTVEFHEYFDREEFYWWDEDMRIRLAMNFTNRWGNMSGGTVITFIDGAPSITTVSQNGYSTSSINRFGFVGDSYWGISEDGRFAAPVIPSRRTARVY